MSDDEITPQMNSLPRHEITVNDWAYCSVCRGVTRGRCLCWIYQDDIDNSTCPAHREARSMAGQRCRCDGAGDMSPAGHTDRVKHLASIVAELGLTATLELPVADRMQALLVKLRDGWVVLNQPEDLWWRPKACGYTRELGAAGIVDEETAKKWASTRSPDPRLGHADRAMPFMEAIEHADPTTLFGILRDAVKGL